MYDQKLEFQSGSSTRGGGGGNDRPTDRRGELPRLKLVSDGNGNITPLGKYTDNSSIVATQGFQRLLERFELLNVARKLLKGERTSSCFYNRVTKEDGVGVLYNEHRKKANYSNIMRCANPWGCPVCSAILSEHRKNEVKKAIDWWRRQGGSVLLLTLTVPHYSHTDIKQLKTDLRKAYGKFFKGNRASQALFSNFRIEHYISAFEVTHGQENGFHPHYHVLLFVPYQLNETSMGLMQQTMFNVWQDCCTKAGLPAPSAEHGLHLQGGNKAGEYITKMGLAEYEKNTWGLEHEMTKGHVKKGKKGSRTPFDLLRDYLESGNETDANLFKLYYYAFKGSRQLNWSSGLKKLVLKDEREKSDQEIVNETDNVSELLFKLDIELWNAVRKTNRQGELLNAVVEDRSLIKARELIRQCLIDTGQLDNVST